MTVCVTGATPFVFNEASFRLRFTEFASPSAYPTPILQENFDAAGCFVANKNYGWLAGCCNLYALNLMTAHLTKLGALIADGQTPGIETQATIDKVSVAMMEPPVKDGWDFWLNQTPYGQALLALLTAKAVGGAYVPGGIGRAGFGVASGAFFNGYGAFGGRRW